MFDTWVKNIKTGDCWRLDEDDTKPIYIKDGQTVINLADISNYKFYPVCPKEPPTMGLPNIEYKQLSFDDYKE